ncbi:MAG: TrmH family RNA methyltransferase [Chitinophagales bacterium]
MQQLNHQNIPFSPKKNPITIVCDGMNKAHNIGSLFRIADTFGVEKIIFCNTSVQIPSTKTRRTSRSTEKYIDFEIKNNTVETIQKLKATHDVIALDITDKSKPLQRFSFQNDKPIALVLGNEMHGISEESLSLCDIHIHIDMFGKNSSMNVVQACNIALYEIVKQL